MNVKPWYASSTLWFNVGVVAVFIIEYLMSHSSLYGPWVQYADLINGWLALIAGVVNLVMRLRTHAPIQGSPGARLAARKRAKLVHSSGED